MPTKSFGKHIKHADAKDYFDRYIAMKKTHGNNLRGFLSADPKAQRFFCGRHGQDPASEDWAYVFDEDSLDRLRTLLDAPGVNSLVILQGIRNKEATDPATESDGRPTILVFPAKFTQTKGEDGEYEIGDDGEEHPGSGGANGVHSLLPKIEFPKVINSKDVHEFL